MGFRIVIIFTGIIILDKGRVFVTTTILFERSGVEVRVMMILGIVVIITIIVTFIMNLIVIIIFVTVYKYVACWILSILWCCSTITPLWVISLTINKYKLVRSCLSTASTLIISITIVIATINFTHHLDSIPIPLYYQLLQQRAVITFLDIPLLLECLFVVIAIVIFGVIILIAIFDFTINSCCGWVLSLFTTSTHSTLCTSTICIFTFHPILSTFIISSITFILLSLTFAITPNIFVILQHFSII